jgi:hypothetical protein
MDAATTFTMALPDRRSAEGMAWAFDRAVAVAVMPPAVFRAAEIFKKTLCIAGLRPAGRDVAQHMPEVDDIPFLSTALLDRVDLHGESITVSGAIAENVDGVMWKPCQDVVRSADKSITVMGDAVGLAGNPILLPRMLRPLSCAFEASDAGNLNLKLTDKESTAHTSETPARATNHTSTALWDDARRMAPGAGGADEKRCYADH